MSRPRRVNRLLSDHHKSTMLILKDSTLLRHQCFVGGRWTDAENKATFAVTNPADGRPIGSVPLMGASETRSAIGDAERAWPAWKSLPAQMRGDLLRAWHDLIVANIDDLALILTAEQGKPLAEARGEITYAAAYVRWFAEQATRISGDTLQSPWSDRRVLVTKEAVGVCAAITPWNFPAAMITRKAAPALAAGCTIIIKPAELTPLSALALATLAERAGIPTGVINVVTGDATAIGEEICSNPAVRKLSFTGSTAVGRLLMRQCASTVKKLSLELGGNAPFIVFDDADLDAAVEGAIASKFRNTGQTYICANRLFVQDGVYDAFAEKLVAAVARLRVGNGLEDGINQGPLIDEKALHKVEQHIADAVINGARVVAGGRRHSLGHTFFEPTVLTGVTTEMLIGREETFGPLAPLLRFTTEEEVIRQANDMDLGWRPISSRATLAEYGVWPRLWSVE